MATIRTVVLAKRPKDKIIPGETFKLEQRPAPKESDLQDGQVILEVLYLSLDPAMRGWLNGMSLSKLEVNHVPHILTQALDTRSYIAPVKIGETMRGGTISVVKASRSSKFPVGTHVTAMVGWTEQAIANEKHLEALEIPKNAKLTDALGVLGGTGLTAYHGLLDVGRVKAGDFVVVSGAAGATGSVVCQIAKLKGAKVLGIAGSEEKVAWLKELGCDNAINYKDPDFHKTFRDATKGYIDLYFDNVGGEILDMALARAKTHARFVMCGGISQYNSSEVRAPKNYLNIISQRIRMEGFIVFDFAKEHPKARRDLAQWLAEGKIKSQETIVKGGIEHAEEGLAHLFAGKNTGKMLVEVKAPGPRSSL